MTSFQKIVGDITYTIIGGEFRIDAGSLFLDLNVMAEQGDFAKYETVRFSVSDSLKNEILNLI